MDDIVDISGEISVEFISPSVVVEESIDWCDDVMSYNVEIVD